MNHADDPDAQYRGRQERTVALGQGLEIRLTRDLIGLYRVKRSTNASEQGMVTESDLLVLLGHESTAKLHDEIGTWLRGLAEDKP